LNPDPDLLADLVTAVAGVRSLFGAAACSCALVDDDGSSLTFVAADGEGAAEVVGLVLPVGRGIAGWAAMSGQPIGVRDVRSDPRFARDVAESTNYVPTSVMAVPLFRRDGEVLGVLELLDPAVDQGSDWTLAVLGTLGSQVAALVTVHRRVGPDRPGAARTEELVRRVVEAVEEYAAPERP
jgi:signal transduction protein with GAF and PtsI domain